MNRGLTEMKKPLLGFVECEPFFRCFFWMCFYGCSLPDVKEHNHAYPKLTAEVNRLQGTTFNRRLDHLNDLLRSFEGETVGALKHSSDDEGLY